MGIRYTVLTTLKEFLDQKPVVYNNVGNGRILTVVNTIFDVANTNISELPKMSIIPAPETVNTGLYGHIMDSVYRVAMVGFICKDENEELFKATEDFIEFVEQTLTDWTRVNVMINRGFSITNMGPVLNEQYDEPGNIGYVSIPLEVQFVQK